MASAPPDKTREHTEQAAALALLLARSRARYDLPALLRQHGIKPRPFRRIIPTSALASDLAAPHFSVVKAWTAELPSILAAVPFGQAAIGRAIEAAARRVELAIAQAKAQVPAAVNGLERWHRGAWTQRVKAATGLDVSLFTSPQDVAEASDGAVTWNRALAEDVGRTVQGQLAGALLGLAAVGGSQADAETKAADVIAKARRRAARIGADQAGRTVESMTTARRSAASLSFWRWHHLDPQPHPRPEHQARDGKVYSDTRPPPTMPGQEPFCKCWSEPLFG